MHYYQFFYKCIINDIAVWVRGRLLSGDTDIVIKTLLTFHRSVPDAQSVRVVALLLLIDNPEVRAAAG